MFRLFSVFSLLFISILSVSQATFNIYQVKNKKSIKYGLIKKDKGKADTLYSAEYDDILFADKGFMLCENKVSKKNKTHYTNIIWLDSNLIHQESFDFLYQDITPLFLVETNGKMGLFNYENGKYILENCSDIELHEVVRPNTERYYNDGGYQYTYDYYFSYIKNSESGIYKVDHGFIIQQKREDQPKIVFEDDFISLGGKVKDIFSLTGKLLHKGVLDYDEFDSYLNEGIYYRLALESGNQSVLHNQKIIIKDFEGKFNLELNNNSRFRTWKDGGYIAVDSSGRIITPEPYQSMFTITPPKTKGVYRPNLVQQNDEWFFVDNNFMPINNERFVDAELVGETYYPTYFYLIKDKIKEEPKSFVYSSFGRKAIDHRVESAYFSIGENTEIIVVENNGKQAYSLDGIDFSNFEFEAIGIVEPMYEPFIWVLKNDEVIALKPTMERKESHYFGNLNLSSITGIEANWEYDFDIMKLKKGNAKTFSLALFDYEKDKFKVVGDFEFEEIKFDEYLTDSYNLLKIKKNGKWGLLQSASLDEAVPFKYDEIVDDYEFFDFEMIRVLNDKKVGVLGMKKGDFYEIVPAIYDDVEIYEEFLILEENGLYGVFNLYTKKIALSPILKDKPDEGFLYSSDFYDEFYSGKRAIVDGEEVYCYHTEKFGYVFGEQITQPKWGDDTYYYIHRNGKIGLIYNQMDTLLMPEYDNILIDENYDLLILERNGKFGVSSTIGKMILDIQYDEIVQNLDLDCFLVKKNDLYGLYQMSKEKMAIEYNEIIFEGFDIYASKNGEWYLLDDSFKPIEIHKAKSLKDFKKVLSKL